MDIAQSCKNNSWERGRSLFEMVSTETAEAVYVSSIRWVDLTRAVVYSAWVGFVLFVAVSVHISLFPSQGGALCDTDDVQGCSFREVSSA